MFASTWETLEAFKSREQGPVLLLRLHGELGVGVVSQGLPCVVLPSGPHVVRICMPEDLVDVTAAWAARWQGMRDRARLAVAVRARVRHLKALESLLRQLCLRRQLPGDALVPVVLEHYFRPTSSSASCSRHTARTRSWARPRFSSAPACTSSAWTCSAGTGTGPGGPS